MLEVFNTLLRQLRLSVDYELTGSYDGSTNIGTKIIKAHEERQLQEAVIRTIGESVAAASVCVCENDCVCVGGFARQAPIIVPIVCVCLYEWTPVTVHFLSFCTSFLLLYFAPISSYPSHSHLSFTFRFFYVQKYLY